MGCFGGSGCPLRQGWEGGGGQKADVEGKIINISKLPFSRFSAKDEKWR